MSNGVRCHCQSCTIRGLTGPAVVITVGVLFLLHQVHGGSVYFGNTWPVIILVIGLLHLASALSSREGHIEPTPMVGARPAAPPLPGPPESAPPPSQYSSQGQ
jgi:hypothetical protein